MARDIDFYSFRWQQNRRSGRAVVFGCLCGTC